MPDVAVPRIAPLPEAEWDEELRAILDAPMRGTDVRLGDNNIFNTLARHRELFKAWLRLGGYLLRPDGALAPRERELLILRTGYNCASAYEWGQHVRLGEQLGMEREEIMRVAAGPDDPGWSHADATLLRAADELHERARISQDTWDALAERFDECALIEITMLVGQYHLVAFTLNSLEIQLDDGLEGLPR